MKLDAIKLKNKLNGDEYHTLPGWKDNVIDGVRFAKVFRMPSQYSAKTKLQTFYIRRDSLEIVK